MVRHGSGGHRSGSIGGGGGGHSSGGHHSSGTGGGSHSSGSSGPTGGGGTHTSGGKTTILDPTIGSNIPPPSTTTPTTSTGSTLTDQQQRTARSLTEAAQLKEYGKVVYSQQQRTAEQFAAAKKQTVAQHLARGGSLPGTKTEAERKLQQQEARNVIAKKYGLTTTAQYLAAGGYLPGTKTAAEAAEQQKQATGYLLSKQAQKDAQKEKKGVLRQEPAMILSGVDTSPKDDTFTTEPADVTAQRQKDLDKIGIGKEPYKDPGFIVTEVDRPKFTWSEFFESPISEIRELPTVLRDVSQREKSKQIRGERYQETGGGFAAGAFAAGAAAGFLDPVLHPIEFIKGIYQTTKGLVTDPTGTVDKIVTEFKVNPEGAIGEVAGQLALFQTIKVAAKKAPVKFEVESYTFSTEGGGKVTVKVGGVKIREKGYPLGAKTKVDPAVIDVGTGQPVSPKVKADLPFSTDPYTAYSITKPKYVTVSTKPGALDAPITMSELAGSTTQPLTASGGEVVRGGLIEYTPDEITRVKSAVKLSYDLGTEKGMPVEQFVVNIEGVKYPVKTTKLVEGFVGQEGVIYGSLVSKQLPGEVTGPYSLDYLQDVRSGGTVEIANFQNIRQGDIDIIFPDKTVAEIKPEVEALTKQLQAQGENVQVSPTGKGTIIEFKDTGEKFLEVKSGIDQAEAGLADEAPAAYLGIEFPDFKKGQKGATVPFGETRAITAGEQLQRKGAGATIMSSGQPGETPAFSEAGVLGKQVNPRGLKDTAGFVQQAAGIIEIKQTSTSPLQRLKSTRAKKEIGKFLESYTPEQQTDILNKLDTITGSGEKVKVQLDPSGSLGTSSGKPTGIPGILISEIGYSTGSSTGPSPGISKTPSSYYIEGTVPSPSPSPVPTKATGQGVSLPVSPSPTSEKTKSSLLSLTPSEQSKVEYYIGWRSPSPSPSPHVESPSPISPSLSRSPSPGSGGSPSPISPSPSPSPPPSPISPSPSPPPSPPPSPSPRPGSPSTYSWVAHEKELPPPKVSPFLSIKDRDKGGSYDVLVRRGGLFKKVGTRETAAGAVAFGKFRVEHTAAASFKIRPMGSRSKESVTAAASRLLPIGHFRESKKDALTFIEKRHRRIKTHGEKKEITALGIFASKHKTKKTKKKRGLFGGF